jgi:hypothetical protein
MNEEHHKQEEDIVIPEWLEKLQKESWQAEILISGGAFIGIIGLLNNVDFLPSILEYSTKLDRVFAEYSGIMVLIPLLLLAEGFLLHLVLRGYWIGLIGMNYVFPKGIDRQKLAFRGSFSTMIKVSSNTPYLIRLDKFCSLVFAYTFFIIFSFAGFLIFLGLLVYIAFTILHDYSNKVPFPVRIILLSLMLSGVIVLIDFFTFGRLKRSKWFSTFYFPIHYFMSFITLSFLYRRLYYTIVSNIKSRYIILVLIIQITLLVFLVSSGSSLSNEILPKHSSNESDFLSLKENIVTGKSLQFSIMHIPRLEIELLKEWKKANKDTSIKSFEDIRPDEKLRLIGSIYEIHIDSIQIKNLQWMIQQNEGLFFESSRLISLIDVSELPRGSHQLIVRIRLKPDEYKIDRLNPNLNYYAKAYFFIDR